MKAKRVFLTVLDSLGAGAAPDAEQFGDGGANTLFALASTDRLNIPTLRSLGIGNIEGLSFLGAVDAPRGAYGRMREASRGKDTTIGHWEICGVVSDTPLPTYPNGFPPEVLEEFSRETGRGVLCNKPYSGTAVICDYGREHIETGNLIVYTSADSVFQIAAHEEVVPVETLYEYCRIARRILTGKHAVGRVIARPFVGQFPNFTRTARRHDFSVEPPRKTLLDALKESGFDTLCVGKINDIFAGRGVTESKYTSGNDDGMKVTEEFSKRDFCGLCFTNLVDFDMVYGHRRDAEGYAEALSRFDAWLGNFLPTLKGGDIMIITADHGCDPSFNKTTDHTREYVPLLVCGGDVKSVSLGTRETFADIAATVADALGCQFGGDGKSFLREI